MIFFAPTMCCAVPSQSYVDIIDKKAYNNINTTYTTTDINNEKVVTMDNGILLAFSSKLDDFFKYAPKEVLEAFKTEFIPELKKILKENDENKLFKLLDDWIDTIDIYSNPETINELENTLKEVENGETLEWIPGTFTK